MPRQRTGRVKVMFTLPPALVKAIRRVAADRRQTNSTVVEEWVARGVAEHDARKVAEHDARKDGK